MTPGQRTIIKWIIGALVALVPPFLVYLQAHEETHEKYLEANMEASVGYKTLATTVDELRQKIATQSIAVWKLRVYIENVQEECERRVSLPEKPKGKSPVPSLPHAIEPPGEVDVGMPDFSANLPKDLDTAVKASAKM